MKADPATPQQIVPGEPAPPSEGDERAEKEAVAISAGKLRRSEAKRRHIHIAALILFWFAVGAFLVSALVWLFQELTPESWHFLSDAQKSQLQTLLISSIGSSVAAEYGRRWFKDE